MAVRPPVIGQSRSGGHEVGWRHARVDVESGNGAPAESFLRVLDQFAALHTYAGSTPTAGGYRVLGGTQRTPHKASKPSRTRRVAVRPATAGARMRLTGSLSVLFIGGLGLAVLAGPANCPCSLAVRPAGDARASRLRAERGFMNAGEAPARPDAWLSRHRVPRPRHERNRNLADHHFRPSARARNGGGQRDDLPATTAGSLPRRSSA